MMVRLRAQTRFVVSYLANTSISSVHTLSYKYSQCLRYMPVNYSFFLRCSYTFLLYSSLDTKENAIIAMLTPYHKPSSSSLSTSTSASLSMASN